MTEKPACSPSSPATPSAPLPRLQGSIDILRGDIVHGWLSAEACPVLPILFMDNRPARCVGQHIPRPDVAEAVGCEPDVGFAFKLSNLESASVLTLYAALPLCISPVCSRPVNQTVWENRFFAQLARAAAIARQPEAVAITCWDGSHNPAGRGKVLYDIVTRRRPAVFFCYVDQGFGASLWPPLLNSDMAVVTVPWAWRRRFRGVARDYGLAFNTVWICKPRLPSFMLAADIAHADTRFLCDMDDDEDAFSLAQPDSSAAYDAPGMGLASLLRDCVAARTVVSPPLRKRFGGTLMRHARDPQAFTPRQSTAAQQGQTGAVAKKIAFIGTVREHKNLLAAARALNSLRATVPLEFHILGDIAPDELQSQLSAAGAILGGTVPLEELPATLAGMDAVITGFPPDGSLDAHTRDVISSQVPAKISDALAAGLPVLTPDTPAIADLRTLPGVYPFTRKTFASQVRRALAHTASIRLPADFTLEGAYKAFAAAEAQARPVPALTALLPQPRAVAAADASPALVLLWKQQDAGVYGRRVDQIARSYRRRFPDHRVYLLELEHADSLCDTSMDSFCDEAALREDLLRHKRQGCVLDGITYAALSYADEARLRDTLTSFFAEAHLTPFNTVVILFPILSEWHAVSDIVTPFPLIVDVVDNQISWAMAEDSRCRVLEQYYGLLAHAGHVVFNAKPNMDFFSTSLMLGKEAQAQCIPNWYTLPDDFTYVPALLHDGFFHLWYSGNMNDRVDWELLRAIAAQRHVRLHLAGTASRCMDELRGLLANKSVIYHGVITERETLALLQCMDAAIVPHLVNRVSRYMDPLKIRMYAAVGLPTLCPPHLGGGVETVRHYGSRENCVQLLGSLASQAGQRHAPSAQADSNENAYMELVASVRLIPPTTA